VGTPVAYPAAARVAKPRHPEPERKDSLREAVETVVFVVFLVLLLKAFVAEAFVIPTGSMATTLLGDHLDMTCDKCGYEFPVNVREHLDRDVGGKAIVIGEQAVCPNCRHVQLIDANTLSGGDKVLVSKPQYDLMKPGRLDVIVFKFPGKLTNGKREDGPQKHYSALNYIKRLWGLPGEKLAIWYGDIYLSEGPETLNSLKIIRKPQDKKLEMRRIVYDTDFPPKDLIGFLPPRWDDERFVQTERRGPAQRQPEDWRPDEASGLQKPEFRVHAAERGSWLRYYHRLRPDRAPELRTKLEDLKIKLQEADGNAGVDLKGPLQQAQSAAGSLTDYLQALEGLDRLSLDKKQEMRHGLRKLQDALEQSVTRISPEERQFREPVKELLQMVTHLLGEPQLVTDFLGYNTNTNEHQLQNNRAHWVPDLMMDFELEVEEAVGKLTLELVAGVDRHLATLDLSSGEALLQVIRKGQVAKQLKGNTTVAKPGKYKIRFDNFDHRLTLSVDGKLPFGPGLEFDAPRPEDRGPRAGDLSPAAIGAEQARVKVRHMQLWRDIYYTRTHEPTSDVSINGRPDQVLSLTAEERQNVTGPYAKPAKWHMYYDHPAQYYTIPDGEYFALGDNSTRSSDSRDWGSVPERLLLGRAVVVYWPLSRLGVIR
jgi:signal peptidase I